MLEDEVTGSELHQEDVAEQRVLIENLKAQRAHNEVISNEASVDGDFESEAEEPTNLKRAREEEEEILKFSFTEPEVGERAIATNSRVSRFHMQPKTKQLAWGAAVFALGMSAV